MMTRFELAQHLTRLGMMAIILVTVSGCVSTSVTSYKDPAFTGATFQSVAVWVDTTDLEWRQQFETTLQKRLVNRTGSGAVRMLDIAPPTRRYEFSEMLSLVGAAGADAVLVIVLTDADIVESASSNQYGVFASETPWTEASVSLYQASSGMKVWTGTAKTEAGGIYDSGSVQRVASSKIIADLLTSGLLHPPSES